MPKFLITEIQDNCLLISFYDAGWIQDGWPGCIVLSDIFLWGRFHNVNTDGKAARFCLDINTSIKSLKIGDEYEYLDIYWGERAELVYDSSRVWLPKKFTPSDTISILTDGTRVPNKGGWDHEHCMICWNTIRQHDGEQCTGYADQNDEWVCNFCYQSYVKPRSLAFIEIADKADNSENKSR